MRRFAKKLSVYTLRNICYNVETNLKDRKGGGAMRGIFRAINEFARKADMLLLALCVAATVYGTVIIASATNYVGSARYVIIQLLAMLLGIAAYVILTLIDVDIIAERRELLMLFCAFFIALLQIFGVERGGNRSWLDFGLPIMIQPAEICKIFFIIILAKTMAVKQNRLSSPITVAEIAGITVLFALLIRVFSWDDGMMLNYLFIFIIMAFTGGVNLIWFLLGGGAVLAAFPFIWSRLGTYQQNRILVLFDETIDPDAQGIRYQMNRTIRALQNGGVAGQGLYNGAMVQSGSIPAQHTDSIFSACGEELGVIGCLAILLMLGAIIVRCIYVGYKSGNYMNRMICTGIAGMLASQIAINVGMCVGLFPVVGLTLPFFSYGGSSIITMFAAMGFVSGIKMRPAPDSNARYIRPKL